MVNGLTLEGQALKITQITAAQLQAAVTAFANADNAYNAGRSAQQAASDAFQAAQGALTDWLGVVRTVLAGSFGQRWSTVWAQAGFINNTTSLPSRMEDRFALAGRLVAFFTKSPSYEVPSMQVTAAQGTTLLNAIATTQNALTQAGVALQKLDATWTDAYTTLVDTMWSLVKILQATLDDDDPRWLVFGLPMPGTPSTPGQPVNLSATTDDTGAIISQCDAVPLATRYRWRTLLVGLQTDYQLAASTKEPMASLPALPPGQAVQIIVQAVNGNLQGVASDPLIFTVPVAKAAPAAKRTATAEATTSHGHANGNGHSPESSNGHARHPRVA